MVASLCPRCTRVYDGLAPGDRFPRHLNAQVGLPCLGAGEPVPAPGTTHDLHAGADWPSWPLERR